MLGRIHLPANFQLKQYQIYQLMGEGKDAVIYYANDLHSDHPVAIKEFYPHPSAYREARSYKLYPAGDGQGFGEGLNSFLSEASLLSSLEHPGLAERFNHFELNGTAYLVMQLKYNPNISLYDWSQKNAVNNEKRVFNLLRPVFDAVEYLSPLRDAEQFQKRDLKPSNIILSQEKDHIMAALLDNSAVRRFVADVKELYPQKNAEAYFAPEHNDPTQPPGPFTDVYSCGALVYALVTGEQPPTASERKRLNAKVKESETSHLSYAPTALNFSAFSPAVVQVVSSALALDSFKRYQNISSFVSAFRLALSLDDPSFQSEGKSLLMPPHLMGANTQKLPLNLEPKAAQANSRKRLNLLVLALFIAVSIYISLTYPMLIESFSLQDRLKTQELTAAIHGLDLF